MLGFSKTFFLNFPLVCYGYSGYKKKLKKKILKKFEMMIYLFHRLCKNQQFPHDGFFFDEKETLEE